MNIRKAGRPLGGRLSDEDKVQSVVHARELQKQWRVDNPERYTQSIKKYCESRKIVKEINEYDVIQKFLKRIKCISINAVLKSSDRPQTV